MPAYTYDSQLSDLPALPKPTLIGHDLYPSSEGQMRSGFGLAKSEFTATGEELDAQDRQIPDAVDRTNATLGGNGRTVGQADAPDLFENYAD